MSPATMLGLAKYAMFDAGTARDFETSLLAVLRRDWAVRVLDRWLDADSVRESALGGGYGGPAELRCCHLSGVPHYGNSLEAARLAAAEALWPELPDSVRAELGERP